MKYSFIFLLIFITQSCSNQNCQINKDFDNVFSYHLSFVKSNYKKNYVLGSDLTESISILSEITKRRNNVKFGDVSYYDNYTDFRKDVRNWENWYSENKCSISKFYADSIVNIFDENFRRAN